MARRSSSRDSFVLGSSCAGPFKRSNPPSPRLQISPIQLIAAHSTAHSTDHLADHSLDHSPGHCARRQRRPFTRCGIVHRCHSPATFTETRRQSGPVVITGSPIHRTHRFTAPPHRSGGGAWRVRLVKGITLGVSPLVLGRWARL